MVSICPVVLAGGGSRRMGHDKALLEMSDGRTLLQRARALLRGLSEREGMRLLPPLVSGKRPGGIADAVPGRGPLGGLYSIGEYLRRKNIACDALLAIPVDMPLLRAELLEQLCAEGVKSEGNALCFGRCYLPLWLRLNRPGRAYLREFMEGDKDASINALVRELGRQLEMPPGDWHLNVNRPEEFAEIVEYFQN